MNRVFLLSIFLVAGCSPSPIRQLYGDAQTAGDQLCDCYMALGSPSREACLESTHLTVDRAVLDCLDREYSANPSAADPAILCQRDAMSQLLSCIGAVSGCDAAMLQVCAAEAQSALGDCPAPPESVQMRFIECLSLGDRDGDGISDGTDGCPEEPEDVNGVDDGDGCPDGSVDNTYAACSMDADCTDLADSCYGVTVGPSGTSGQFCSRTCAADADCEMSFGFQGACYSVESTASLCYQRCDVDADCYASSVCVELTVATGEVDFVCVPDN